MIFGLSSDFLCYPPEFEKAVNQEEQDMGTLTIKVSDLTGEQIGDEREAARLVVEKHPNFAEPITLDVHPEEVIGALEEQEPRFVVLTYYPPAGQGVEPRQAVMPLEEFNALATKQEMNQVLENANRAQQEEQRGVRGRRRGGRQTQQRRRARVDYASPEHAGEPHAGRVSPAEQEYVREYLDEVNARLREQGVREIDPTDPEMASRYGLTPQPTVNAEAGGEAAQSS